MWKYHLYYGYIINRAFHTKKLLQWNGLVFHWCLYNKKNITWPLGDTKFLFPCWRNISTVEEKFRISARPCNILYLWFHGELFCAFYSRGGDYPFVKKVVIIVFSMVICLKGERGETSINLNPGCDKKKKMNNWAKENVFRICIAWYNHERGWENSRQLGKPESKSRVCITVENSPNPSSFIK